MSYFYPYSWEVETETDSADNEFTIIHCFGHNPKNENVYVKIQNFSPYAYLELDRRVKWNRDRIAKIIHSIKNDTVFARCRPLAEVHEVKRKFYYADIVKNEKGEYEHEKFHYIKVCFETASKRTQFSKLVYHQGIGRAKFCIDGRPIKTRLHEYNADPILQLFAVNGVNSAGWNRISKKCKPVPISRKESLFQHEYHCDWDQIFPDKKHKYTHVPSPLAMSMDVEAYSSNENRMPVAENPMDAAFQIACIFHRIGSPEHTWEKYLLTLKNVNKARVGDDVQVIEFKSENQLLHYYAKLVQQKQPNVIYGYNVFGWDFEYLYKRSITTGCEREHRKQSYLKGRIGDYTEVSWGSKAVANQFFKYIKSHGVLYVDIMVLIKRDYNFNSYTLKYVSDHFLGATKEPLSVQGIFRCYREGTPDLMAVVGKYCVVDAFRTAQLFEKLDIYYGLVEMANICHVSVDALYFAGQQKKVHAQAYCYGSRNGIVVETDVYKTGGDEAYTGAIVFDPSPAGFHENVVPFDYASLYPSVMITKNLSQDTLVVDDSIPDELCNVFEWEDHQNCCFTGDTLVSLDQGESRRIDSLRNSSAKVLSYSTAERKMVYSNQVRFYDQGVKDCIRLMFEDGTHIDCTPDHKILNEYREWVEAQFMLNQRALAPSKTLKEFETKLVVSINHFLGKRAVYDIEVENTHTFIANGVIVHNCHDPNRKGGGKSRVICAKRRLRSLKSPRGILPSILTGLLDARAATRREIKEIKKRLDKEIDIPEDERERLYARCRMLDKRQLAYKISANSVYGSTGVREGRLPCMKVAMMVTAAARAALKKAAYILSGRLDPTLPKEVLKIKPLGCTLVYGDTDSCYVKFPGLTDPKEIWKKAIEIEEHLTQYYTAPMKLEFEGEVYGKFVILSKKRYAWIKVDKNGVLDTKKTPEGEEYVIGYKGIILKRRDNCSATKMLYADVLNMVFNKEPLSVVSNHLVELTTNLYSGKWKVKDFIISKKIKGTDEYAVRELSDDRKKRKEQMSKKKTLDEETFNLRSLPAHVYLGEKMKARGQIVEAGMRLPYIVVESNTERAGFIKMSEQGALWEKVEDPVYYMRLGLQNIDYSYYLNMVCNQIDQLMEIIYNRPKFLENIKRNHVLKRKQVIELKNAFKVRVKIVD